MDKTEDIFIAEYDLDKLRDYRSHEMMGNTFRKVKAYNELLNNDIKEPFKRCRLMDFKNQGYRGTNTQSFMCCEAKVKYYFPELIPGTEAKRIVFCNVACSQPEIFYYLVFKSSPQDQIAP